MLGGYTVKVCPRCQSPSRVGDRTCRSCGYTFVTGTKSGRFWPVALIASIIVVGVLVIAGRGLAPWVAAPMPTESDAPAPASVHSDALQRAIQATVQVIAPDPTSPSGFSAGSGTVVDAAQGIILTNFHVIGDPRSAEAAEPNTIQIAVTPPGSNQPPETLYLASVVEADNRLDLAVLRITARRNGGSLPDSLELTDAPLGDSAGVAIGDAITILGYPGLGGDTITLTRGSVSGFVDGWIKTDAEINHGNSGGAAIDAAGRLIGVPSAGVSEEVSDERLPGKIGLVRPIDQARRLLERAGVN